MISAIYHMPCPKADPDGQQPIYEWNGFSMAGIAEYTCPLCKDTIAIEEESIYDILRRLGPVTIAEKFAEIKKWDKK